MTFLKRVFGASPNGNGSPKPEEPSVDLSEVRDMRKRIQQKASEPLIPEETRERLSAEMSKGSEEVDAASSAVQESMSELDAELAKRSKTAEEDK
jgi:hypothetical protein